MNDARPVDCLKRPAYLNCDQQGLFHRHRSVAFNQGFQVDAVDKLHDEEEIALFRRATVGHVHYVGVPDLRRCQGFALKAAGQFTLAPFRATRDLDRHALANAGVVAFIHAPHGAFTDTPAHVVAVAQNFSDQGIVLRGRTVAQLQRGNLIAQPGGALDQLALLGHLGPHFGVEELGQKGHRRQLPASVARHFGKQRRAHLFAGGEAIGGTWGQGLAQHFIQLGGQRIVQSGRRRDLVVGLARLVGWE